MADLKTVFGTADAMASKAILEALHRMDEAPWNDLKGKPLNERGLAHRLRQYGVTPKNVAVGTHRPKGYRRDDLYDAWVRYLPAPVAGSATSATSATSPENRAQNGSGSVADGAEAIRYAADEVADEVADVADGFSETLPLSACEISEVAQVADVADLSTSAGVEEDLGIPNFLDRTKNTCAQCGAGDDLERRNGVWLHRECVRFWNQRGAA